MGMVYWLLEDENKALIVLVRSFLIVSVASG